MSVRLFVAVDVGEVVKDAIESEVVEPLRAALEGARWTRPEGRHLTLSFLGWVDEGRVEEIGSAVERAAEGLRAFEASLAEVGGFPSLTRPRVLWVGIGEGATQMQVLAAALGRELAPLGFPPEDRAFHPHLTLARFKRPRKIAELPPVEIPSHRFEVSSVTLFGSELHPEGARYTPLVTGRLRAAGR